MRQHRSGPPAPPSARPAPSGPAGTGLPDPILVAEIGAAHGIRGEVRVKPHTADPEAIGDYGPLTAADGRRFTIRRLRPAKGVVVVVFEGVSDRNAAEALAGTRLYVDRSALPEPEDEDEFYHADLVGLVAETAAGEPYGRVTALHDFGAGDLVEIARPGAASVLLPFSRAVVPVIDVAGGRIVVAPPAELVVRDEGPEDASEVADREDGPHTESDTGPTSERGA